MYFSSTQIETSLNALADVHPFFGFAFLGFKKFGLPVGKTTPFSYSVIRELVLDPYFKPIPDFDKYYSPYRTSNPSNRWISGRYESASLQRIVADTFADAFLHEKRKGAWGWRRDYVEQLKMLQFRHRLRGMPLGHLGVWLYRDVNWNVGADLRDVRKQVIKDFNITQLELRELFLEAREEGASTVLWSKREVQLDELLDVIGDPRPDQAPVVSGLRNIKLTATGPSPELLYSAAPRTNVITGDNSLGKTFLLDSIWWALTGKWVDFEAAPNDRPRSVVPSIEAAFNTRSTRRRPPTLSVRYSPAGRAWRRSATAPLLEGVGLYVLSDGRFAIWDSERVGIGSESEDGLDKRPYLTMTHAQALHGLENDKNGKSRTFVCNGLIQDIVAWSLNVETYASRAESFYSAIAGLSPSMASDPTDAPVLDVLRFGKPVRLPGDSREMPTLEMPYGLVPIVHASAGVQRIITIAYLMVWAWHEHLERLHEIGRRDQPSLVILVDEIESHLHPKWQRLILPSLIKVAEALSRRGTVQFHIATHSPIVMTSVEAILEEGEDRLHHLRLGSDGEVALEELELSNRGSVNDWLQSIVFDGQVPWSPEAEEAMSGAENLMKLGRAAPEEVRLVHEDLVKNLPDVHKFWPRWRVFASKFLNYESL